MAMRPSERPDFLFRHLPNIDHPTPERELPPYAYYSDAERNHAPART
jgi:hypothetical protein